MQKRSPYASWLVTLAIAIAIIGVCGLYVIWPLAHALCFAQPDSIRNPPTPPNAEQIKVGKPAYKPYEGYEGKLITFWTTDSPTDVYEFYKRTLVPEGWLEDTTSMLTTNPNQVGVRFTWDCGIDSPNLFATLWLNSERLDSGKTEVNLNLEYLPH